MFPVYQKWFKNKSQWRLGSGGWCDANFRKVNVDSDRKDTHSVLQEHVFAYGAADWSGCLCLTCVLVSSWTCKHQNWTIRLDAVLTHTTYLNIDTHQVNPLYRHDVPYGLWAVVSFSRIMRSDTLQQTVQQRFEEHDKEFEVLTQSPNSPDLSSIKRLWDVIQAMNRRNLFFLLLCSLKGFIN